MQVVPCMSVYEFTPQESLIASLPTAAALPKPPPANINRRVILPSPTSTPARVTSALPTLSRPRPATLLLTAVVSAT
ncbi:hypothetical protein E2C01_082981 [Portunus trituberculatus]|uniref:Uncharacterized protein n=1 Tax=Portunus trituberculatus TaxID=210409 RepID=A0A5B7IRA1_PORTR|nr:hypothetical protein [Portunus trituberculatus]